MQTEDSFGYMDRLNNLGIRTLGFGGYSTVYEHPSLKELVVKLITHDAGYLSYVDFALDNQDNPWVPKIISKHKLNLRDYRNAHIVFIERLEEYDTYSHTNIRNSILDTLPDNVRDSVIAAARNNYNTDALGEKITWKALAKYSPDENLKYVLKWLFKCRSGKPDIHIGNIMIRNNTELVIIDPLEPHYR